MIHKAIQKSISLFSVDVVDRARLEMGDIDDLAANIDKHGLINPICVKAPTNGDGLHRLLAGGRRFAACAKLGWLEIPANIYPPELTPQEEYSIELMENIKRKDMEWQEEIRLKEKIHKLQQEIHGIKTSTAEGAPGWSLRDTADLLGENAGLTSQDLKLARVMDLMPDISKARNKSDAKKILDKTMKSIETEQKVSAINKQNAETPEAKRKQEMCARYILGDFLTLVKDIPTGSIDICEVDPPYGIDLQDVKFSNVPATASAVSDYTEVPRDLYEEFIVSVVKECARTLSDKGWLILWHAQEHYALVRKAIEASGLTVQKIPAIWRKEGPGQCQQPDYNMANTYEPFLYARKHTSTLQKRGRSNVFSYKPAEAGSKIHPTERPVEMIQEVLSVFASPGDRVMVPFLGSGNTMLAADNLDMLAFGYDKVQEYKNEFICRVSAGELGKFKSYKE